jgi:Transcriptional regulator, AbiEi antitoxin, Type IV TA system/Transcriptional regulator, AbiEi antitoxin N-terminal domain
MDTQNKTKINKILMEWPSGAVVTQKWLTSKGVSRFLARSYVKGGWIKSMGAGAFFKADGKPLWSGGLYTIQQELKLPIHAGGETALRWHGYGHTAPMNSIPPVYLFGPHGTNLPSWFLKFDWANKIQYQTTDFLPYKKEFGFTVDEITKMTLSSPERAMFETLLLMPHFTTFEGAADLMEGLSTLRPNLVTALLKACQSVKVKRCFLYLAEQANHSWFKELNLSKVKLGKGKRVVVPGGTFDSKYQITVPTKSSVSVP